MQTTPMIFRCDASSEVGWGFFRRCYALAEIAQQSSRFRVYFLTRQLQKSLKKKLQEIHASSQLIEDSASVDEDLAATHGLFDLMSRKKIVVVVDNKDWTSECFDALKQDQRIVLIAIDHGQNRRYNCDILINPAVGAEELTYQTNDECVRLLGPKYALIREEIYTLKQHPTERMADSFQFLISLGAGDRWGYTLRAIEAVRKSQERFETHIVVTSDWPHLEAAKKVIGNHPRIHLYEDPSFFPQLLARADLALCAAGNTTYELAYLGVPMMTISLDPIHDQCGLAWSKINIGEHLGSGESINAELLLERLEYWMQRDQELEERGIRSQSILDGRGKFRILERLSKILSQDSSS